METSLIGQQVVLNEEKASGFTQQVSQNKPQTATIVTLFVGRSDNPRYTLLMEDGSLVEKNGVDFKLKKSKKAFKKKG